LKIYSDDPNLPYKTTKLKTLYTKSEIDGLFAKWGVKDVYWHRDPECIEVLVQFKKVEEIDGMPLQVSAKVEAPSIWDHKTRSKAESVNWDISMRVLYWFIKSHLEAAYLLRVLKRLRFCRTLPRRVRLPQESNCQGKTGRNNQLLRVALESLSSHVLQLNEHRRCAL
jgi:hypothetical protein